MVKKSYLVTSLFLLHNLLPSDASDYTINQQKKRKKCQIQQKIFFLPFKPNGYGDWEKRLSVNPYKKKEAKAIVLDIHDMCDRYSLLAVPFSQTETNQLIRKAFYGRIFAHHLS